MNTTKAKVIKLLGIMDKKNQEFKEVNQLLTEAVGDEHESGVICIQNDIEIAVLDVLDEVLGEDLATYYLYDSLSLRGGKKRRDGFHTMEDGTVWPLTTLKELTSYINMRDSSENPLN